MLGEGELRGVEAGAVQGREESAVIEMDAESVEANVAAGVSAADSDREEVGSGDEE